MNLAQQKCIPCEVGAIPLTHDEAQSQMSGLKDWRLEGALCITKQFIFKDFVAAMEFVNSIARIAEEQGHHPDIEISYNKVLVSLTTHSINGLTVNDFILAAKIDAI